MIRDRGKLRRKIRAISSEGRAIGLYSHGGSLLAHWRARDFHAGLFGEVTDIPADWYLPRFRRVLARARQHDHVPHGQFQVLTDARISRLARCLQAGLDVAGSGRNAGYRHDRGHLFGGQWTN